MCRPDQIGILDTLNETEMQAVFENIGPTVPDNAMTMAAMDYLGVEPSSEPSIEGLQIPEMSPLTPGGLS